MSATLRETKDACLLAQIVVCRQCCQSVRYDWAGGKTIVKDMDREFSTILAQSD